LLAEDAVLALLESFDQILGLPLIVVNREVDELYSQNEFVLGVIPRCRLDKGNVEEDDLTLVYSALVKYLRRNVLGSEIDALLLRLLKHGGEEAHLELEGEQVDPGGATLAAFGDDLFDKEAPDGEVDRPDDDQPAGRLTVKKARVLERLRFVRPQDQLAELALLSRERLVPLLLRKPPTHVQIRLPLVTPQVQNLEGPKRFSLLLELPLHTDQTLARCMNRELP